MQSPLKHHVTFRGRDFEQLQRYLSGKSLYVRPENTPGSQPQRLDARLCGVYFDSFYLSHIRYDMDTLVTACDPDMVDYFIQFPLAGDITTRTRRGSITCNSSITSVSSPGNPYDIRSGKSCQRYAICLYKDALNRQWTSLTGDCTQSPLQLEDRLDLTRGFGRKLSSLVNYLASELTLNPASYQHPIVRAQLEQLLLTEILINLPHSRSNLLRKSSGRVVPQTVKRVIDYIHAYPGEPITLALLCRVSGVAGRTLNTHFRKYTGMSPVAYARHVRLQAVRDEIIAHGGETSVTQIATRWGFEHLSRFSQFYRSQFGELPSETLRKAGLPAQPT